jgi:uncharacterized membrane protein YvlD (DUF360 family)
MRILVTIIINALILYALTYLLWPNEFKSVEAWVIVTWWLKTYLIWWVLLWIINFTIKPILKILSLPFFFLFLWLVVFVINWIILWLLDYILNNILAIPWVSYSFTSTVNFIIAVAIFTILNIVYTLLFSKK